MHAGLVAAVMVSLIQVLRLVIRAWVAVRLEQERRATIIAVLHEARDSGLAGEYRDGSLVIVAPAVTQPIGNEAHGSGGRTLPLLSKGDL